MLIDIKYNINNSIGIFIALARHEKGIYEIGHFSFGSIISNAKIESYPEFKTIGCYGVCDDYKQILKKCRELKSKKRKFVISITPVEKEKQPEEGGWRWHKWGEYIGKQKPTCEYLYDEPVIEKVYCYHIYEIIKIYE